MSGDEREQPSERPSPGSSPGQKPKPRQRKSPGPSSPTLPATPTPTATPPDLDARWPSLADHAATVADAPRETIVPPSTDHAIDIAVTTAGKRTLGLLREIDAAPAKRLEVSDEKLGRGGMSDVWLGEQTALGRPVAVKTVREDLGSAGGQTTAARELLREAVLTGRLEHPNVLPVHDLTLAEDGAPLIVLKRVEGESWTELLEAPARLRARFGVEDPLRWHLQTFMQVCSAAHAAHARGVVHRDIKPDNVMIGPYGEVYLMDWGIAVAVPPAEGERSAGADLGAYDPSVLAGTPVYLAPEMVLGEPVTPRTDVYLLGATLFELLSGDPPHVAGSLRAIAQKALRREPPPLPERVAPDLAALCRRCLRFDPTERFESAEQLRRAVQRYLEQRESRLLAENARDDLVALETAVEEAVARPEEKASHVFDLYGACRFGFQAALRAWPENAEAREGLTRAVEAMIRLEIARQNARGAEALLAELEAPP
ncbi:MAG: hypothetical protein CMH59_25480, partial [Myxococcales bacterium]|nr:hypothetical protein [Myxococcales bacterium]HJK89743.1 serine/threonine-protein kinase [Polyangiaceae bacterium LLY-WYZ-15_(1-7)]